MNSIQDAKLLFCKKTGLSLKKNDFNLVRVAGKYNIFSAVVEVHYKNNEECFRNSNLLKHGRTSFMLASMLNWDDGSRLAIDNLSRNPNYKDVFKIIKSDGRFDYYSESSKNTISELFNNVENIWQYDKPDVVIEEEKSITGLEFFKINAAGRDRRGSIGSYGHKDMLKELTPKKAGVTKTVTRHFNNSLRKLFDDFVYSFNNHMKKINIYEKTLSSISNEKKKTAIGFFVDDTTLLGTYYRPKTGGFAPLYMFNLKEFWDLYFKADYPLFFIFTQTETDIKNMFFITKSDYDFLASKNSIWSIDEVEQMFFNDPHLIGASFNIDW